jgi:hypothetical protein
VIVNRDGPSPSASRLSGVDAPERSASVGSVRPAVSAAAACVQTCKSSRRSDVLVDVKSKAVKTRLSCAAVAIPA